MDHPLAQDYIPSEEDLLVASRGMDIYLLKDGIYVTEDYEGSVPCLLYIRREGETFILGRAIGRVDIPSSDLVSACMIAYMITFSSKGYNPIDGIIRVLSSVRARVPELTAEELQLWTMKLIYTEVYLSDRVLASEDELRAEVLRRIDLELKSLNESLD